MKHIKRKTPRMLQYETERGLPIEEILRRMYVDENMTIQSMAEQLNLGYPHVQSWLKQAGIYSHKLKLS